MEREKGENGEGKWDRRREWRRGKKERGRERARVESVRESVNHERRSIHTTFFYASSVRNDYLP